MNTFSLKIIACDKVFYDGPCELLVFPGYDGEMAIMAHHENMTTSTNIGEIHFRTPDGENHVAITSDGLLKVKDNTVELFVFSAEKPEEIDAFRAQEAKERAEEELRQKLSQMEYNATKANLARAMERIKVKNRHEI